MDVPDEWNKTTLGNIATYINGYAFKPTQWGKKGKPIIRIQNLTNSTIIINRFSGDIDNKYLIKEDDFLISWSASLGAYIWKGEDAWLNQHIFKVDEIINNVDKYFLYYSICYKINEIKEKTRGSTMKHITKKEFLNIPIILPPLPEQQKIAHVLSTIQEAKERTETVIAAAKELKRSLMKYLFTYGPVPVQDAPNVRLKETEIGMIPEEWEIIKISDEYEFSRKERSYKIEGQVPFIAMEDIHEDSYNILDYQLKDSSLIKSGTIIKNGDLLIAKITPSFENGKQGIAIFSSEYGYATTEVWPLHSYEEAEIGMLYYYLKMPTIRNDIANKMEGATGRQRIPKSVLSDYTIPYPSIMEQKRIINLLQNLDNFISKNDEKINGITALFNSMLEQLMTGTLRVNDIDLEGIA